MLGYVSSASEQYLEEWQESVVEEEDWQEYLDDNWEEASDESHNAFTDELTDVAAPSDAPADVAPAVAPGTARDIVVSAIASLGGVSKIPDALTKGICEPCNNTDSWDLHENDNPSTHVNEDGRRPRGTTAILVPQDMVGSLIGKGGETVKSLCAESGAHIEMAKATCDADRMVHISGKPECIEKAKRLITETLKSLRDVSGLKNPDALTVRIPVSHSGIIIGRGGETVKRLRKESGARINVSKVSDDPNNPGERVVYIAGPLECVEYAKSMVENLLSCARWDGMPANKPTTVANLNVSEDHIGPLIGKNGERIKEIQNLTSTRIRSIKNKSGGRTLHIFGTSEDVDQAKRMIDEKLGEVAGRQIWQAGCKEVMHVPPDFVGVLIGRHGEQVREIQMQTGCQISTSRPGTENEQGRRVTLTGSHAACERARDAIKALQQTFLEDERKFTHPHKNIEGGLVNEKIYIDELNMNYRSDIWHEFEDGLLTDVELFVKGLLPQCTECDLWEGLRGFGAHDVREILLVRKCGQSKGMAYIIFQSHESAVNVRRKLNDAEASSIPCSANSVHNGSGRLSVRFSESERCVKGPWSVYHEDMTSAILGVGACRADQIREGSGLRKVVLSGENMRTDPFDLDPRVHMIAHYPTGDDALVTKAISIWERQHETLHLELVERRTRAMGFPSNYDLDAETSCKVVVELRHVHTGEEWVDGIMSGQYQLCGENHSRPVYRKYASNADGCDGHNLNDDVCVGEVFIYYLNGRDSVDSGGWWFGSSLSGDDAWAKNTSNSLRPPETAWQLLCETDEAVELVVRRETNHGEHHRRRGHHRRRRHRQNSEEFDGIDGGEASSLHRHAPQQLPKLVPPWVSVPHEGSFYFLNVETGGTTWHPPPGCVLLQPGLEEGDVESERSKKPKRQHRHSRSRCSRSRRSRSRRRGKARCRSVSQGFAKLSPSSCGLDPSVEHLKQRPDRHNCEPFGGGFCGGCLLSPPQLSSQAPPWLTSPFAPPMPGLQWELPVPRRGRSIIFARAQLGDAGLASWSRDFSAPDGGPSMLRLLEEGWLSLVDFSHNGLSDHGAETLIAFLIAHQRPVKRIKLFGNKISSTSAICQLLKDPICGLRAPVSVHELHLSYNLITATALQELLETIADMKGLASLPSPLWIRIEGNGLENHVSVIVEKVRERGLEVCIVTQKEKDQGCTMSSCISGADIHLYCGGITPTVGHDILLPGPGTPRSHN